MLSFSLRAVLRKESWIFCAGLFSICRSPCTLDVQNQLFLAARGAGGLKAQGGKLLVTRSWRASGTELLAVALRTIRGHARLFNLTLKKNFDLMLILSPRNPPPGGPPNVRPLACVILV